MSESTNPKTHKRHTVKIIRQLLPGELPMRPTLKPVSFQKVANSISTKAGSPYALLVAIVLIICWAVTGPFFNYSDTWQLIINTSTTIVTFLMVFAIQNTQNRDSRAMQIKLDELIKSSQDARMEFVDIEELSDKELDELNTEFKDLHAKLQSNKDKAQK